MDGIERQKRSRIGRRTGRTEGGLGGTKKRTVWLHNLRIVHTIMKKCVTYQKHREVEEEEDMNEGECGLVGDSYGT